LIRIKFVPFSCCIVETFLKEHVAGREFVADILTGVQSNDKEKIIANLGFYSSLLKDHIIKEDTILYPWMNRTLSDTQIGILFSRCTQVDNVYHDRAVEMEAFVESI
jgi:hemerythrin-like domain-containing protein